MENQFKDRLIEVVCIKSRDSEADIGLHFGDYKDCIVFLDPMSVFSLEDGEWYGTMYRESSENNTEYTPIGIRKLSRYACCSLLQ